MTSVYLLSSVPIRQLDTNGAPVPGALLHTWISGTTTNLAAYTDSTATTPLPNPIEADSEGFWPQIWLQAQAYDLEARAPDDTTVLWPSGAILDASVRFQQTLAANNGAASIGYGNSTHSLYDKVARVKSLIDDFQAVGDNVADDTGAVLAAAASGYYILGHGNVYKVSEPVAINAIAPKFNAAIFDCSTIVAPYGSEQYGIRVSGSLGSAVNLTADAVSTSKTATLTSGAGFTDGDWVMFNSTRSWGGSYLVAFITRLRSVSGNVVTFCEQLPYSMFTANGASLQKINMVEGVMFDNCEIRGLRTADIFSTGGQVLGGLRLDFCLSPRLPNFKSKDCNYTAIELSGCVDTEIVSPALDRAHAYGLAYGILVGYGSIGTRVIGGYVRDMRHGVTHGGSSAVNRDTVVDGLIGHDMLDALVDSHENSDGLTVSDCQTSIGSRADGTSGQIGDGFISQGANWTVEGCKIVNAMRYPIIYQASSIQGGIVSIVGNEIDARNANVLGSSTAAIFVDNEDPTGSALLAGVVISNNVARGARTYGIEIDAVSGNIHGVTIADNQFGELIVANAAVQLRSRTGTVLLRPKVTGGSYSAGQYGVYVLEDTGGSIQFAEVRDTTTDGAGGAVYPVRVDGTTGSYISGNRGLNTTAAVTLLLTGTQTSLDAPDLARVSQTIATDAIALANRSARYLVADTEAGAATDNLSTITGGKDGAMLTVVTTSNARDITVKDGVGNLRLAGDFLLDTTDDSILLQYDATAAVWRQVSSSNNA